MERTKIQAAPWTVPIQKFNRNNIGKIRDRRIGQSMLTVLRILNSVSNKKDAEFRPKEIFKPYRTILFFSSLVLAETTFQAPFSLAFSPFSPFNTSILVRLASCAMPA